ncbi:MAG TPA: sodium-dependent transporter [Methanoregula sp.]|nr:sodium-dependent transporter [Methanoregula sp.]
MAENPPWMQTRISERDPLMERWSSHIGFILAAIGAAVGLGNIWRFSSVLGQNGGGAYLIPYFIAVFVVVLPLMILEIAMGRRLRGTAVSSFSAVRPEFRIIGWLVCAVSFVILGYYLVITGWTIAYLLFSITGETVTFSGFTGSYQPVIFAMVAAIITSVIVSAGIRKGIERLALILIPACIVILVIMALYSITLPGFRQAMQYLFTPDFSVLSHADIWLAAFGQALFSLSVGEGILLTYGAYMEQEQDIRKAAIVITIADFSVAILAGLVIFPVVFSNGLSPAAGSELAFTTLPLAFATLPAGRFLAIAFFAVLFFAAITSAVSMLEVCVAAVDEATGWTRGKTTMILAGILVPAVLLPALSYSSLHLSLAGTPLLDILDETVGTIGLHVVAILLAITFTWFVPSAIFWQELGADSLLNRFIFSLCKYLIPVALLLTVVTELVTGTDFSGITFIRGAQHISSIFRVEGVVLFSFLVLIACLILGRPRGE